ncbi:hypothetical protein GCM10017562_24110 [Streptomyces roseofulvus]|uniref:DUF4878 domain-containing protein n=2 Tax=Streptomyces TaxID=1883 RepID=A0ABU4KIH8_9ACTN|nr:hypothetical protein [Streptomyces roseolus]MDX2297566.1 hypothetical protein [Streptomyces roseolus]
MTRRGAAALAVVGCVLLAGCTQGPDPEGRTERQTAEAYVRALNDRDAAALAELAPPGYEGVEADARAAVAADGGKGIAVADVEVSHEFGDDVASTRIIGTDRDGSPFRTYVSMAREDGTWVVVLGHAPGAGTKGGASPASTERP